MAESCPKWQNLKNILAEMLFLHFATLVLSRHMCGNVSKHATLLQDFRFIGCSLRLQFLLFFMFMLTSVTDDDLKARNVFCAMLLLLAL